MALAPASGTAPAPLRLTFNPNGVAAGTYSGVLAAVAPNSFNVIDWLPVSLTVFAPPPCTYTLVPSGGTITAAGGSGSFTVFTGSLCAWTATTTDAFVTIPAASAAGTGSGIVQYSVGSNGGVAARTGTITVNGQSYTITQFGSNCALTITPANATATAAGGLANVNVTTTNSSCAWTASGLSASPTSGTGNGNVSFIIPANTNVAPVTLNAQVQLAPAGPVSTFTVIESGAGCTFSLSAPGANFPDTGGSGQVTVTTPAACSYSTVNGPSWITTVAGQSGAGSGTLTYSVASNSTTVSRTGTLTIGGVPFTITQAPTPCSVTVDATNSGSPFGSGIGSGILAIDTNGPNCSWAASSPVTWITLTQPSSGTGNGAVQLNVSSNASSTTSRSANLTVAGQSVTVTQGGTICSYVLGSANSSIPYGGGSGSVSVTAPGACAWSSATDPSASWLTISSSGAGGSSNVAFVAAPNNSSTARSGTLTIAGQPFTVNEAAGPCTYILSATSATLAATSSSGLFTFSTATSGCPNQAVSFANWLTATATSPDGFSGTVNFTATANPSGANRNGTIQFAGQTFTVTQTAAACAFSLNSYGLALGQAGGMSNVFGSPSVQGCTPTVGTNQPTIVTLGNLTGPSGNIFTLPFVVMNYNSTVTGIRTMVISFGGQLFTIKQTSW